ncbi:unnamed protein product [Kuraishia capsulata CBS 1993]|uniref:Major facilitator superfamily (MFS) profile domain-containing protein n=1 Tax=Kuraishia capsulata CBS 1993 TaxID=1382522 RepID=W6MJN2_9ASCO|nr:uncharacterized protein KUCA_T00000648001 [Kuraishia capsulata CBS 1993]CDK24682.1 unnamed protein product [Kuraishia capsulata CBS 1993]
MADNESTGLLNAVSNRNGTIDRSLADDIIEEAALHRHDVHPKNLTRTYSDAIDDSDESEDLRWLREQRVKNLDLPWFKRPSVTLLSAFAFIFTFAMASGFSAQLNILLSKICFAIQSHVDSNPEGSKVFFISLEVDGKCDPAKVQKVVSMLQTATQLVSGFIPTVLSGTLGRLSDRYGRRPLFIANAFFCLASKFFTTFTLLPSTPFMPWLYVFAQSTECIGGGLFFLMALCNSYVTDVVEPDLRISSMGSTLALTYLGLSAGPLVGSFISKAFADGGWHQMYFAISMSVLVFCLALAMPESRSSMARSKSRSQSVVSNRAREVRLAMASSHHDYLRELRSSVVELFSPLKLLWISRRLPDGRIDLVARVNVLILVALDCIITLCSVAFTPLMILYGTFRFNWTSVEMGYLLTLSMAAKSFSLLAFSPACVSYLKRRFVVEVHSVDNLDRTMIVWFLLFEIGGSLLLLLAGSSFVFMLSSGISGLGSAVTPALHSSLVKHCSQERTGEVFGAIALYKSLLVLTIPPLLNFIYYRTVETHAAVCFYIQSVLFITVFAMSFLLRTEKEVEFDE